MSLIVDLRDAHEISDHWRLCEEFTVKQAALLIVGCDPGSEFGYCEGWKPHERPTGYEAAKQALTAALRKKSVSGTLYGMPQMDINGNEYGEIEGTIEVDRSTLERESLVGWLRSRGLRGGFFFPTVIDITEPDYLTAEKNERYAPKLAAAVRAWQAVTNPNGKSPKQALVKWLREHAAEFGLSDDEGKPNETGIEEVAKVANWQPGGGSAKTPGA